MKRIYLWLLVPFLFSPSVASAQNVTGYGSIPEPLLFLLREPAVLDDLGLSSTQRSRLIQMNESFDGAVMASRNKGPDVSLAEFNKVLAATKNSLQSILNQNQQDRLKQIKYRLRGMHCVQMPEVAQRLRLNENQKDEIDQIIQATKDVVKENSTSTYPGPEAYKKAQAAITAAQKSEQKKILDILSNNQKQTLFAVVGKSFDASKLGNVRFKAPDFAHGDQWINSQALQMSQLRGKVIALHFYAFG